MKKSDARKKEELIETTISTINERGFSYSVGTIKYGCVGTHSTVF